MYVYTVVALHHTVRCWRCGTEGYCFLCCYERKACWKFEGYDGCPEQLPSDVISLYKVGRLLASVAEHTAQISLRASYCVSVPEQSWSLLLTAVVPVDHLIA